MCVDPQLARVLPRALGFRRGMVICCLAAVSLLGPLAGLWAGQSSADLGESPSSQETFPSAQKFPTLLLQADLDYTFALDDQPSQALKAAEIKRISATLGEHLVV